MKHWQELGQVLSRIAHLEQDRCRASLAVVVRIEGSAFRRPGARLLILEDGVVLGGVSGGCLEEDVRQVGLAVIRSGTSRLLRYDTGDDDSNVFGLGLGCDGRVEILVQPVSVADVMGPWARVGDLLAGDDPFVLTSPAEDGARPGLLVTSGDGGSEGEGAVEASARAALRSGRSGLVSVGERTVFHEVLVPPPKLLVLGGGADAEPLVSLAAGLGFRVYLADHRPDLILPERFPAARERRLLDPEDDLSGLPLDSETFCVVKTHSLRRDTAWVERLLATEVKYVGIMGPRARTEKILADRRRAEGLRVYGPVGLDLGADGPEQVALSIMAEVLSLHSGRAPQSLRERRLALHAG